MDNNYNNNQSSDSFYSYNNQQTQNSEQNQQSENTSDTAGQNGSYSASSTNSGTGSYSANSTNSGTGSQMGSTYGQNNTYGNQYGTGYGQTGSTYGTSGNQAGNTYGQGNTYQGNTYGYQNTYGSNGAYQQGMYQNNPNAAKKAKKKKEKKPGNFGTKIAKCAALALVFGLVAGTAFEGVRLVSANLFGDTETVAEASGSVLTQSSGNGGVQATSTSSNYVATDVSDIVDEVMPSIVAITNISQTEYRNFWGGGTQTYESTSAGSGIIVSESEDKLYIVTNNHVVDGATSLTVAFSDNSTVSAEIKGTDPSTDLAVISVALDSITEETMGNIKVATLGNSDELKVGEASIAIGNALGYGQSVTTGCISALNREVSVSDSNSGTNYTAELIQTDAAINPGNSGGALLNAVGEVIGINSVKYSDTSVEGIGYAIPISTAMPIIEDLITKEKVDESESAFLGIAGVDVTDDVASTYGMPTGVYVAQVTAGSAAEQYGIKQGDIITAFDGKEISTMEELSTRMQYYKAGTTVDVTIKRASEGQYVEQVISVTLGKKN